MSQDDLATAVAKDQRAISEYENGKRKLAATDLPLFAQVLDVPLMFFFEDAQSPRDLDRAFVEEFQQLPTNEAKQAALAIIRILSSHFRPLKR